MEELFQFLDNINDDPRIATVHISVYVNLWKLWMESGKKEPLSINRQQLMSACKVSGFTTFHKTIKQLDQSGYIGYAPSFNHFIGSQVYFTQKGIAKWRTELRHLL